MKSRAWAQGFEAARKDRKEWEKECTLYKQKVELQQRPLIRRAKVEGGKSQEAVRIIDGWLNKIKAKPEWVLEQAKARAKILLALLPFLSLASYGLLFLTFEPFEIGWKAHVASAGIVIATALMMELFLNSFFSKKWLILSFASIALFCLIFAHVQLGLIRAELFKTLAASQGQGGAERFYEKATGLLFIAFPMLALGIELATGLTLHSLIEWLFSPEIRAHRKKEIELRKMVSYDQEIQQRMNLPDVEEAEFRTGAMAGLAKKHGFSSEKRLAVAIPIVLLIILLFSLFAGRAFGEETSGVVTVLDLTKSSGTGKNGEEGEFQKNLNGIENYIRTLEAGTNLAVIGLLDKSFSKPVVLLRGRIGSDQGYFKQKLNREREEILKKWKEVSRELDPVFSRSDVFGAIALAQILLNDMPSGSKTLLIFSDMRHSAGEVDLETPEKIEADPLLAKAESSGLIPSLRNVQVFVLGAHTNGKSTVYWQGLKKFWEGFFVKAGACLKRYSFTREVN